jgi:hypothetical protein
MKTIKITSLMILFVFPLALNAQINVQQNGNVSVGKSHSLNNGRLKMGNDGLNQGISFYDSQNGGVDAQIYRMGNSLRSSSGENETTGIAGTVLEQCKLYQNTPNPFQVKTEIRYFLPEEVKTAKIYIFNMQGSLIKKLNADRSGSVEIKGADLSAGMYLYTLVTDGKEVDTKRMILTK